MKAQTCGTLLLASISVVSCAPPEPAELERSAESAELQPLAEGTIGFVGCSMSNNAVEGYVSAGGSRFWSVQNYGGGGVKEWGANLSDSSKYWAAFQTAQEAQPASVIWWELCTTGGPDTYARALQVAAEIKERAPGAALYVSAQPAYTGGHVCQIAGANGPARMQALASQLVTSGVALAGPTMGPLSKSQTMDGCHGNASGKALMGGQLLTFFGSSSPDDPPPDDPPSDPPSSVPHGIYSLNQIVDKPYVDGYVLRTGWKQLEPSEGTYNFKKIDDTLHALPPGQKLTLTVFVNTPTWLTQKCAQKFTMQPFGETCLPWDETMLVALEEFIAALGSHTVDGTPLRDHPLVAQVDAGVGGIQSIRLTSLPNGYSRDKLEKGVLRSVRAWGNAFSSKHLFLSLFAINDGQSNPTTAEYLRDELLAEFDGAQKPRLNFFIEYLTGLYPDTTSPLGKVLYDVHDETSIMMQACGEWSNQIDWPQCNWKTPSDKPQDGFNLAFGTFGTRYFEIYPADLLRSEYTSTFQQWSTTLNE